MTDEQILMEYGGAIWTFLQNFALGPEMLVDMMENAETIDYKRSLFSARQASPGKAAPVKKTMFWPADLDRPANVTAQRRVRMTIICSALDAGATLDDQAERWQMAQSSIKSMHGAWLRRT